MNVGPLGGVLSGAAGSPLQQAQGSDSERAAQETGNQQRADKLAQRADDAAGVGQTQEDQETAERDADGRRFWERAPEGKTDGEPDEDAAPPPEAQRPKDPSGASGNTLDLTG